MITIFINGNKYLFKREISILEACKYVGILVPRFCYNEYLPIAGNCRMCLVEVEGLAKPVLACSSLIIPNIKIYTQSPFVLKARENILEALLLNHPLDCPICDQGGECDLQDQAIKFGSFFGRNFFTKRGVESKLGDPIIKTIMTRCIHCTRCVRFSDLYSYKRIFGTINRGNKTEISTYLKYFSSSEISGNVIELCPVGALTLKSAAFQIRPWEIQTISSIDLSDSLGSNIYLIYKGFDILKVLPKKNFKININWITNKTRFYFDPISKNFNFKYNELLQPNTINIFLFNPIFDLKLLKKIKDISFLNFNFKPRVLNILNKKINYYKYNIKPKIETLSLLKNSLFLLLAVNLKLEMPLLNIRLKSIFFHNFKVINIGCAYKNIFPLFFTKFTISDFFYFFNNSIKNYYKKLVIFTTKIIYNRLDSTFFFKLNFIFKNILFYTISQFCNSEGLNFLNFKKWNLKEVKNFSTVAVGLDDTYYLRKFIPSTSKFFWVNYYPTEILKLINHLWIPCYTYYLPGFYLNLEQKIQKFQILKQHQNLSIKELFNFLYPNFIFKNSNIFLNSFFFFYKIILNYSFLKENFKNSFLLKKKLNLKCFDANYIYIYLMYPLKYAIEDFYRTSLITKSNKVLIKVSQNLRNSFSY